MEEPLLHIIRRAIRAEIRLSQSEVLKAEEAARFLGLEKSIHPYRRRDWD